jgi:type I restriction enzyme S subunit
VSDNKNLKPGWKIWRFDQIALNVTERADPTPGDSELYVGLEHMDTGSLRIRRWGSKTDLIGTKFRMRKGDILFARRNAYLKRVAIAPHDGLFSAHGMILRPNSDVVEPSFLPFFMQSDLFMDRAIQISAGSLSPTINWGGLATQQFPLPPIDEQRQIVGVLDELEAMQNELSDAFDVGWEMRLSAYKNLMFHDQFYDAPSHWVRSTIGRALSIRNSLRKPISADIRAEMQGEYPYYGPTGKLDSINEFRLDGEFVLIGEDGDHFLKYKTWSMTQKICGRANVNNHAHVIAGTDECSADWFFHFYRHKDVREFLAKQGAGRLKLKKADLERLPILVPPRKEQDEIVAAIQQCVAGIESIMNRREEVKALQALVREHLVRGERHVQ